MIKSYCKINLSLRVLKRLKNGLHDIQSNVFLLNLFDQIKIKKTHKKKDLLAWRGKFKNLIDKKKNSIIIMLKIWYLISVILYYEWTWASIISQDEVCDECFRRWLERQKKQRHVYIYKETWKEARGIRGEVFREVCQKTYGKELIKLFSPKLFSFVIL